MDTPPTLSSLPYELLRLIAAHLQSPVAFFSTCKRFATLSEDPQFWKLKYQNEFGSPPKVQIISSIEPARWWKIQYRAGNKGSPGALRRLLQVNIEQRMQLNNCHVRNGGIFIKIHQLSALLLPLATTCFIGQGQSLDL